MGKLKDVRKNLTNKIGGMKNTFQMPPKYL